MWAAMRLVDSAIEKAQLFADVPGAGTVLRTLNGIDTGPVHGLRELDGLPRVRQRADTFNPPGDTLGYADSVVDEHNES